MVENDKTKCIQQVFHRQSLWPNICILVKDCQICPIVDTSVPVRKHVAKCLGEGGTDQRRDFLSASTSSYVMDGKEACKSSVAYTFRAD